MKAGDSTSNLERPATLAALFYMGFASAGLLTFKPLVVGTLIDEFGFSASQAGFIAALEMTGIGCAGLLVVRAAARYRRMIVCIGAVLGITGSFAPLALRSFDSLIYSRTLAGLGCGVISFTIISTLGMTRNPDRTFGWYLTSCYIVSAAMFPTLPHFVPHLGAGGVYAVLGLLLCGVMLVVRQVPTSLPGTLATDAALPPLPIRTALLCLSVSLVYWIGNGAVWAFVERLGLRASLDASEIARALSLGQLASMAGALVASLVNTRFGRTLPIFAAISTSVAALLLLALATPAGFTAGTMLFCLAWSSFLVYLGGLMSSLDRAGRIVGLSVSTQTIGMAIGPAIGGMLADTSGYGAVVGIGIVCHLASAALLVPAVATRKAIPEKQRA